MRFRIAVPSPSLAPPSGRGRDRRAGLARRRRGARRAPAAASAASAPAAPVAVALAPLVLVAGGLIAWRLLSRGRRRSWRYHELFGCATTVPDVIGAASLQRRRASIGMVSCPGREKAERGIPPGRALAEAPKAGSRVARRPSSRSLSPRRLLGRAGGCGQRVAEGDLRDAGARIVGAVLGCALEQGPRNRARARPGGRSEGRQARDARVQALARDGRRPVRRDQKRSAAIAPLEAAGFDAQAFARAAAEPSVTCSGAEPAGRDSRSGGG